VIIDCWEEMMDRVEVKTCIDGEGQEAAKVVCGHISTRCNLMLSEVTDFLIALSPLSTRPMSEEVDIHKYS
jgi:hypothetical protein